MPQRLQGTVGVNCFQNKENTQVLVSKTHFFSINTFPAGIGLTGSHLVSSVSGQSPVGTTAHAMWFFKGCILEDLKSWFHSLLKGLERDSLPFADSGTSVTTCHTLREVAPFLYSRLLGIQRVLPTPSPSMCPVSTSCKPGLDSVGCYPDGARRWTPGRAGLPGEDNPRHMVLAKL